MEDEENHSNIQNYKKHNLESKFDQNINSKLNPIFNK
jgi:hypothetical protein